MPDPETGITPLPDGSEVHRSREELTPEAAKLLAHELVDKRFRVTSFVEKPDGGCVLHHVEVPGGWLHKYLYDWEDGPGEAERVLSVEMIDGGAVGERIDG